MGKGYRRRAAFPRVALLVIACGVPGWSSTSDATILRIQSDIQAGNFDGAKAEIEAALKDNPQDGGLYNLRGIVHANRNELKAARQDFEEAVQFNPRLAPAYLNLGRTYEILSTDEPALLDRAILQYRKLSTINQHEPLSSGNLRQLAAAYERCGQWPEARQILEKLAPANPADSTPLIELARVAQKQNDLNGALGYLAHARDLKPDYAPIHFFFGIVCIELDLPVEAKKSLQKALDLDPENAIYNYARGSVELQGKAAWEAVPYFKKFVAAQPGDRRGHFALGVAEFASQDYDSSAKEMKLAASAKETAAGAEYFLGRIAKAQADWAGASEHLQKSIEADPDYADSHAELGLAKLHLDDVAGARKELDRALALNPDGYIANANLLTLFRRTKDPLASSQEQKLQRLDLQRSEKQDLMLRTIKVSRYAY